MNQEILDHINDRIKECKLKVRAFEIWLGALLPANVVLVGGAALLSLIAGAEILVKTNLISVNTAGILALTSSGFTLIHNRFRCDPHQAECKRLKNELSSIRTKYESLRIESDDAVLREKLTELDAGLAQLRAGAAASPMNWCTRKAESELGNA